VNGKRPKYTRTPDGSLLGVSCYHICNFWAEEDEFEGRLADAATWREEAEIYKREIEYGISWVASPFIERRLEKEADQWRSAYVPWNQWQHTAEAN
jgi:hypothetical protein